MDEEKRTRTGTRRTTFAVLEILKTDTRPDKPISIAELVNRLRSRYSIHTSRDSVKAILSDLIEFYPGPDEIRCKCSPKNDRYQYQYYYRTEIPMELQENIHRIHEAIRKNRGRGKHYPTHFRIDLMTEIQEYKQEREGDEQREF